MRGVRGEGVMGGRGLRLVLGQTAPTTGINAGGMLLVRV